MQSNILIILLLIITKKCLSQLKFTLYHNSDMYSRFEEIMNYKTSKPLGGFARLAQVIETAREAAKNKTAPAVLYLNAGNTFSGTYLYHVYRWEIVSHFLSALSPDVISLGSQEFVDGLEGLEPFLKAAHFPIVSANVIAENGTVFSDIVKPSVILELNQVKVGIIGYIDKNTDLWFPNSLQFIDEIEAIQKECHRMTEMDVKVVIALGHADYKVDKKIAETVDCIDVVVGGDSSVFLWNENRHRLPEDVPKFGYPILIKNSKGRRVVLVEGYSKTKYVGKIELSFNRKGHLIKFNGEPILLDHKYRGKEDVLDLLKEFGPNYRMNSGEGDNYIGKSKVFLSAEKCREEECNLGNMIMDAFVEYKAAKYRGNYWTDTPIAFMNAGAVRTSINTSLTGYNLTVKALENAIPFHQPLITIVLQGIDLKHTLEVGARYNGETRRGEFLLVSGIRVIYDFKRPPFQRVVSVLVRCGKCRTPEYSPLDFNDYYRIMTTVFLANGGDGHTSIRKSSLSFALEGVTELAVTVNYIQTYGELRPECDDRISHMRFMGRGGNLRGCEYFWILLLFMSIGI